MRLLLCLIVLLTCPLAPSFTQSTNLEIAPTKRWDKSFGGPVSESGGYIVSTSDGNFVTGGTSQSKLPGGNKSESGRGDRDYWLIKFDRNGQKIWDKTLGGLSDDLLYDMIATPDGGVVVAGSSSSNISGDKTQDARPKRYGGGSTDFWIVRLDKDGRIIWDKTIGGNTDSYPTKLTITAEGNFIIAGVTTSDVASDKSEPTRGNRPDYWIVKLDANGTKIWDKTLGGGHEDYPSGLVALSDGSVIVTGYSYSNLSYDKTENNTGAFDYWTVKLDRNGRKVWDRTYGGAGNEQRPQISMSKNGEFLIAGESDSDASGTKTTDTKGLQDYWLLKINANGDVLWDKTIGGNDEDLIGSLASTLDGGYIIAGSSQSNPSGDKTESVRGGRAPYYAYRHDYWLVKIDGDGRKIWDKTIGGDGWDSNQGILTLPNGDFLASGFSYSPKSWDKSEDSKSEYRGSNLWVVSLAGSTCYMVSVKSGDWNDPATWSCNRVPLKADNVLISAGHTVSISTGVVQANKVSQRGVLVIRSTSQLKIGY